MLKKLSQMIFAVTFLLVWLASNPDGLDDGSTELTIGVVGGALGLMFMVLSAIVETEGINR